MGALDRPGLRSRIVLAILRSKTLDRRNESGRRVHIPGEPHREVTRNRAVGERGLRERGDRSGSNGVRGVVRSDPSLTLLGDLADLAVEAGPELHHGSDERNVLVRIDLVVTGATTHGNLDPRNPTHGQEPSLVGRTLEGKHAIVELELGLTRGALAGENTSKAHEAEVAHNLDEITLGSRRNRKRKHEIDDLGDDAAVLTRDKELGGSRTLERTLGLLQKNTRESVPDRTESLREHRVTHVQRVKRRHGEVRRDRLRKQVRVLLRTDRPDTTLPARRILKFLPTTRTVPDIIARAGKSTQARENGVELRRNRLRVVRHESNITEC